jgi:hypothetical protein
MKTRLIASLTVALLLGACTTFQQDKLTTVAARNATAEVVRAKPGYRPAFDASVAVLDTLLQNPATTREQFIAALQALKIKELKGQAGALRIADILDAIDIVLAEPPKPDSLPRLRSFVTAIVTGMRQGLALTATP